MAADEESKNTTAKSGYLQVSKNAPNPVPWQSAGTKQGLQPDSAKLNNRIRSASVGRDKKHDLQCRYWGLLFDSLRRAVDELYRTCELEENVDACKEVALVLETYTRDFKSLIEWLQLQWNYEHTPPKQRPTSFAWEVRKTSPLKPFPWLLANKKRILTGAARRLVSFEEGQLPPLPPTVFQKLLDNEYEISSEHYSDPATAQNVTLSLDHPENKKASYSSATQRVVKKSPTPVRAKDKLPEKSIVKATSKRPSSAPLSTAKSVPVRPQIKRPTPVTLHNQFPNQAIQKGPVAQKVPVAPNETEKQPMDAIAEDDDNDGWEMVRGRTRSRTSPAKGFQSPNGTTRPALTRSATNISLPGRGSYYREQDRRGSHPHSLSFKGSSSSLNVSNNRQGQSHAKPKHATSLPTLLVKTPDKKTFATKKLSPCLTTARKENKSSSLLKKTEVKPTSKPQSGLSPLKATGNINPCKASSNGVGQTPVPAFGTSKLNEVVQSVLPSSDHVIEERGGMMSEDINFIDSNQTQAVPVESNSSPVKTRDSVLEPESEDQPEEEDDSRDVESLADEAEMAEKDAALASALEEEQCLEEEMRQTEADMALHDEGNLQQQEDWELDFDGMGSGSDREPLAKWAQSISPSTLAMLEAQCSSASWADEMDLLDQLGAVESRTPGRLLQVHEKLSSPSRKRNVAPDETYRLHEAKQAKAELLRSKFLTTKVVKRKELLSKISEVRAAKDQLLQERRDLLDRKLVRASEKRKQHLADIVKKAHDEDEKLKEIAFINELEAQNKRHDLMTLVQTQEERLQGMQEERMRRRQEERAAREAAIEERKKILASEREAKLAVLQEKRRTRQERIERELQEKEKERLETAREKQRDREERLSALQAAHVATLEAMQKKLQQKQEECARRHEETIGHIRQKALESSTLKYGGVGEEPPKLVTYESPKFCSTCNIALYSDLEVHGHLLGRSHGEAVKKKNASGSTVDGDSVINHSHTAKHTSRESQLKERQKTLKKRAKKITAKLKQRMDAYQVPVASNALPASPAKSRLHKVLRDVERQANVLSTERAVGELCRVVSPASDKAPSKVAERNLLGQMGAPRLLCSLAAGQLSGHGLAKLTSSVCKTLVLLCIDHASNTTQVLFHPGLLAIVDWLQTKLDHAKTDPSQADVAVFGILQLLECIFETTHKLWSVADAFTSDTKAQAQEVLQYLVSVGIVESLALCFAPVRAAAEEDNTVFSVRMSGLGMLSSAALLSVQNIAPEKAAKTKKVSIANPDPCSLPAVIEVSELFQVMSMLYNCVVLPGGPIRCIAKMSTPPPKLSECDAKLVIRGLETMAVVAVTMPDLFQTLLAHDAPSLKWRYVVNYLLAYVQNDMYSSFALPLLRCIAYYAAGHNDNQVSLNGAGIGLPIIQQVCSLPFRFFSDPSLQGALFSCLLACCEGCESNKELVRQEMMLDDYLASEVGKLDPLLIFMARKL